MERRPEPELMDDLAQARAYAEADFAAADQALVERFAAAFGPLAGRVVDLGCGPGGIPLRLARALPQATVIGVDGAAPMLALARAALRAPEAAEAARRVTLLRAHLPALPLAPHSADAVFSNSLLHHLADPLDLWCTARAIARPGAPVFVCDLFRPASEAEAQQIVDAAGSSADPLLRRDFYCSLLAAYTPDEVQAQLATCGLVGALEVSTISERHLLVSGRVPGG